MTDVLNQEYRVTPLTEVQLHPKNPRRADVAELRESIRANGFYGAVIVQRSTGYVLAGNHRVQAAMEEGLVEIPMVWVDVEDEAAATRILLADNRYADKAGYDDKQLLSILEELRVLDSMEGTGFDQAAIEDLERVTGQLAAQQSNFLDDIANRARAATQGGPNASEDPLAGSGVGGIKPTQYFSVSYLVSAEERALVLKVLAAVKEANDLESSAKALLHLCDEYAEANGLNDPEPEVTAEPEVAAPDDLA